MPKPKNLADELADLSEPSLDGPSEPDAFDLPAELDGPAAGPHGAGEPDTLDDAEFTAITAAARPRSPALKIAAAVGAVILVGGGLLWYRDAHRTRIVRQALSDAEVLMRQDTASAYRAAADKLEVPAQLDPIAAGSARAFALAMLACDYRDPAAEAAADELLVAPERAEGVPDDAYLARAALALAKGAMGDASNAASHVRARSAWANDLQARIALSAGQLAAAVDPASAAASDGAFAAGLAIQGDVARRAAKDPAAARAAYTAALAAAGEHGPSPRATFGLAKLALADQIPAGEAMAPLERLVQDGRAPAPERGRAALHLAALRLRAGDAGGAQAALDLAGLDPGARGWAERTARLAANRRGVYRAAEGAPLAVQSRSDDDPPEAEPIPPPPPPEPAPVARPAAAPARHAGHAAVKGPGHKAPVSHAVAGKKTLPKKAAVTKASTKKGSAKVAPKKAAKKAKPEGRRAASHHRHHHVKKTARG